MAEFWTVPPETGHEIDKTARDWAVKFDRGSLSDSDLAELEAWLAADSRRSGALARAEAIMAWTLSARALGPHHASENDRRGAALSRRNILAWGGGTLAAAAVAAGVTIYATQPRSQFFQTQKGEARLIPLGDGTTVTLNTDSQLKVTSTPSGPRIGQFLGEAFFQTHKSVGYQLIVEAADVVVETSGAAFALANLPGAPLRLVVRQGAVLLARTSGTKAKPLSVGAGTEAIVPHDPVASIVLKSIDEEKVRDAFAWLEGKIVLEGEALRVAAEQFYRYSDFRIVIEDPTLAQQPVTGLYSANDPVGFSATIAAVLGAKMRIVGRTIVLSR